MSGSLNFCEKCKRDFNKLLLYWLTLLRDWSLTTGRGGAYKTGGGGQVKFYPYEKGDRKMFAMLKGAHKKFWGSFYAVA